MRRGVLAAAVMLLLASPACAASLPTSPAAPGDDFPGAVPIAVTWPSDWLEAIPGESVDGIAGAVVDLRLEYQDDTWTWRVTSLDPGMDLFGEQVTEPRRGLEALLDAETGALLRQQQVELREDQIADTRMGAAGAARLSGEEYPSPRIIALTLTSDAGAPVWRATMYDTETGETSVQVLDASDSAIEP